MKIFVYGSLREGLYNFNTYIGKSAVKIEQGEVLGKLYAIRDKNYPALLLDEKNIVKGEIITLRDCDLDAVDEMENYFGEDNLENEYNKVIMDIKNIDTGAYEKLPVYVYNETNPNFNREDLTLVTSGDWKNRQ